MPKTVKALSHERDLRIAVAVAGERPLTLYEIARALGESSSSNIQRRLHRLHSEGVVAADPEPPAAGSVFRLRDEYRDVLSAALTRREPPGICNDGQRVLDVEFEELHPFHEVIRRRELSVGIAWAIELSPNRMLLVLSRATERRAALLLQQALESAGITVRASRFGDSLSGEALQREAKAMEIAG